MASNRSRQAAPGCSSSIASNSSSPGVGCRSGSSRIWSHSGFHQRSMAATASAGSHFAHSALLTDVPCGHAAQDDTACTLRSLDDRRRIARPGMLARLRRRRLPRRRGRPRRPRAARRGHRRAGEPARRAAAVAGGRGELRPWRRHVGRRVGPCVGGGVRPALPHPGDRADERALARDRARVGGAAGHRRPHRRRAPQRARRGRHGARLRGHRGRQRRHRRAWRPPEPDGARPGLRCRRGHRAAARLPRPGAERQRHRAAARRPRGVLRRRPRRRLRAANAASAMPGRACRPPRVPVRSTRWPTSRSCSPSARATLPSSR